VLKKWFWRKTLIVLFLLLFPCVPDFLNRRAGKQAAASVAGHKQPDHFLNNTIVTRFKEMVLEKDPDCPVPVTVSLCT
ncbi:hypothetical protein KKD49_11935, partial [Myxococcota bacterium]|nr:hypothetical protein [Myxococcota bacterium]